MIKITGLVKKYRQHVVIRCDEICFESGKISFIYLATLLVWKKRNAY